MNRPRRRRPWALYALWGLFALAFIAWTAWWLTLRSVVVGDVESWMSAQRAAGVQAGYSKVSASGYPLRLTLTFENAKYAAPGGGWTLSTPRVALHVNPSDLSLFIIEPRGAVTWTTRAFSRTFSPHSSAISVHTSFGRADRITLEGEGVHVLRNGADEATIAKIVMSLRPDPRAAEDGQLAVDVDGLDIAQPPKGFEQFGPRVQSLNARVVFEKGAALVAPHAADHIAAWIAAGDGVRVEGLGFVWGPATVTSRGRFALDDKRRLAGRLDLALAKPEMVFAALSQSPRFSPDMADAMRVLAIANTAHGKPLTAPLVIENGIMLFNGLPIRTVDPIR